MKIEAVRVEAASELAIDGEITSLEPELIRLIKALARIAAVHDFDYFLRTGCIFGYDGAQQE